MGFPVAEIAKKNRRRKMQTASAKKKWQTDPSYRKKRQESYNKWYQKIRHDPAFKQKANAAARKNYSVRKKQKQYLASGGRKKPSKCEVCKKPSFRICFDHCHESGAFRGWLCHHCNLVLGHAKDNPKVLRKLADYLEK